MTITIKKLPFRSPDFDHSDFILSETDDKYPDDLEFHLVEFFLGKEEDPSLFVAARDLDGDIVAIELQVDDILIIRPDFTGVDFMEISFNWLQELVIFLERSDVREAVEGWQREAIERLEE